MNPAALKANIARRPARCGDHRQHGRVRAPQPREGRLRRQPARGRHARRVPRVPGADDEHHDRGHQGDRREAPRRGALEELLRARVSSAGCTRARPSRSSTWIDEQFGKQAARPRRERRGVQGGLQLRRDRRAVRPPVRGRARAAPAGALPQHQRQRRARLRAHRRGPDGEAADPLRVVPDHSGVGHPPRALEAQELRRAHDAGRGRDRGDRGRDRRRVRRPARGHRDERARASTSRPRRSGSRSAWSSRSCSWTCSAVVRRPDCRPRPSRPTCCSRCTAGTARRRCRSSRRSRRATASTPRSKACGSR